MSSAAPAHHCAALWFSDPLRSVASRSVASLLPAFPPQLPPLAVSCSSRAPWPGRWPVLVADLLGASPRRVAGVACCRICSPAVPSGLQQPSAPQRRRRRRRQPWQHPLTASPSPYLPACVHAQVMDGNACILSVCMATTSLLGSQYEGVKTATSSYRSSNVGISMSLPVSPCCSTLQQYRQSN